MQDKSVLTNRAARQIYPYQQSCKTNVYLLTALQDKSVLSNRAARQICTCQQSCKTTLNLSTELQDNSVLAKRAVRQMCTYQKSCKNKYVVINSGVRQLCTYQKHNKTNVHLPTAVQDRCVLTNSTARQICTYQQRCKTYVYLPTEEQIVDRKTTRVNSMLSNGHLVHVRIVSSGRRKTTNNHLCQFRIKFPGDIHWPALNLPVSLGCVFSLTLGCEQDSPKGIVFLVKRIAVTPYFSGCI